MKLKDILDKIEKKPIFMCKSQLVKIDNKAFELPRCTHVKIEWNDWMKLRDAINKKEQRMNDEKITSDMQDIRT